MVGPLVRLLIINIPGRLWPGISWLSGDWKGVVCRCDILSPARDVCVNFTTSHPQQSTVDSTLTGTDYVNQLNTEMKGNFILLHLVSLGNSFAICLRNLYKRIRWVGPKVPKSRGFIEVQSVTPRPPQSTFLVSWRLCRLIGSKIVVFLLLAWFFQLLGWLKLSRVFAVNLTLYSRVTACA